MIIYTTIQTYTHTHILYMINIYIYIHTTDVHLSASTRRSKHRVNTSEDPAWPVSGMTSTPVCPWAKALTYKAPEDIAITCNNQSMMYFNDR